MTSHELEVLKLKSEMTQLMQLVSNLVDAFEKAPLSPELARAIRKPIADLAQYAQKVSGA